MAEYAFVALEGVLQRPDPHSFQASQPNLDGMRVYWALQSRYKVFIVADHDDADAVEYWLRRYAGGGHAKVFTGGDRIEQLTAARRLGNVTLSVEANEDQAARLLEHGVAVMLYARPVYTREEFRPDRAAEVRPWAAVTEELDRQRELEGADARVEALTADIARWESDNS